MTEKRFKLFVGKNYGVQKADGEVIFDSIVSIGDADVLVDLLNDLTEENEELKEENKWLKSIHFASDVLKENKELKQEIETLHEQLAHIGDVFE